jgi:uncharacterized LabA/DUF88 family protein
MRCAALLADPVLESCSPVAQFFYRDLDKHACADFSSLKAPFLLSRLLRFQGNRFDHRAEHGGREVAAGGGQLKREPQPEGDEPPHLAMCVDPEGTECMLRRKRRELGKRHPAAANAQGAKEILPLQLLELADKIGRSCLVQAIYSQLRHKKSNRHSSPMRTPRVLVFVDESNVVSSVRALGRKLDWLKLRDHLANADRGRELIEMVIYAGLPPPMPEWQSEREKKNKFLHWLRSNGFLVVAKDGSPGDGKHYKANVDVLMAIDAVELSIEMRPEVVVLVTGDADFAHLALVLRRRGIRVEVAATAQTLGTGLKGAANEVIDLVPLFKTFELMKTGDQ